MRPVETFVVHGIPLRRVERVSLLGIDETLRYETDPWWRRFPAVCCMSNTESRFPLRFEPNSGPRCLMFSRAERGPARLL